MFKHKRLYFIFTRSEGACFEILRADKKQIEAWFDSSVKRGKIQYMDEQSKSLKVINVSFVTVVKEIKNFDLVLKRKR